MHLGRFHDTLLYLQAEIASSKILDQFDQLITHLSGYINSPTDATAQQYKTTLAVLKNTLIPADGPILPPSYRAVVDHIGGRRLTGEGLWQTIEATLRENNVIPAKALTDLQVLRAELGTFVQHVNNVLAAFTIFEVEHAVLEPGGFELGLSIPRSATGQHVEDLAKELSWIDQLLKAFSELVGEGRVSARVRTISSTDWQFFIDQTVLLAPVIAICVERILEMLKKNLEIKKLTKDLETKSLPEVITRQIDEHVQTALRDGIRAIAEELVANFGKTVVSDRKNELTTDLTIGLLRLAKRINQGAEVEVRAAPPELPPPLAAEADKSAQEAHAAKMIAYEHTYKAAAAVNEIEQTLLSGKLEQTHDVPLLIDYDSTATPNAPPNNPK